MNDVSRFLSAIHSHPRWAWAVLLAYAAAVSFPHETVQWAVNLLCIRFTHQHVYSASGAIALVLAAAVTAFLFRGLARQPQRRIVAGLWILTLALICAAWGTLTANNLELVHYPQYFPEGLALAALTFSPVEALSWVVLFGGLDEGYQYWVLSVGRPIPTLFDFNDIYMDLLGGAAGVVFAMAFLRCIRQNSSRRWADGPNKYHTLTPAEGMVLIFATIALYAALSRKYAITQYGECEQESKNQ